MHDEARTASGKLITRRGVLVAGVTASATLTVAGCTTGSGPTGGSGDARSGDETAPGPGSGEAGELGPASEVPVGGGTVFTAQKVVVTQPSPGTFRAFSVTCPHRGCSVAEVADGTINCPCHGSRFNVADGSVARGPAPTGLTARQVSTDGGTLRVS